nr:AraC family transcriptional regulator [Vibrio sp. D420a]
MGCDYLTVMRSANIEPDDYTSNSQDIDGYTFYALWRAVEQDVGINTFSIKVAQSMTFESLSPAFFGCMCSANMEQAFLRMQRYKPLIGPVKLNIQPSSKYTRYQILPVGDGDEVPKSLGVTEIALLVQVARIATRKHIVPVRVTVKEKHEDYSELEQLLGCPIELDDVDAFSLSTQDLTTPLLTENSLIWGTLEKNLEESLDRYTHNQSLRYMVCKTITRLLPDGKATINCVASELAMSSRTLQRKLQVEDCGFQDLLQQTRKDLAIHYLKEPSTPLIEIAFLLGYQDNNSFSRAFLQWCGSTPSQYRLNHPK